jgi:hypothetical protein
MKNSRGDYELFPALNRTQLADQIPSIKKKILIAQGLRKNNHVRIAGLFRNKRNG